jgi:hypothetical protein
MTSVVIDTYLQDVTESLTGNGDDLLVTSAGSLVETEGEFGVDSTGNSEAITIDGFVYSADSGLGTAVYITGASTTLFVNGQVQGDTGVYVVSATGNDAVNVGSQGSVESVSGESAVIFQGNFSNPTATDNRLTNAGDISAGAYGVSVEFGGGDLINNSGQISAQYAIGFSENVATEAVQNSGVIDGELYFDDNSGVTSTIDNEGTITGSGFVISSQSDSLDINNSGTIHGSLYSVSAVDVENSGHWHDGTGSGGVVFSLLAGGDSITNSQAGAITGAISIGGLGDTIDNSGKIDGAITLPTGDDQFTNTGDIDGAITFTGTALTNTFTNSGTITGNLTLSGSDSTFDNSGSITGNVTQVNGSDTMANHGQIYGTLALAGGDTLTNDGVIDGDLTCRTGDTVDSSRGEITGVIDAWASDTFDYHGLFGEQTIDNFTGGTGSTHDTIQFAANDFGSFTAVQSAMSQIGPDVVIRLDASDSITLANVTVSSLVSADFKFV